ncbi:MAG: hypothetical protein IPL26_19825 [Leptospiraceae bacterium]|nr:hypothetical protein [Leptospiraceae bacterium]
MKHLLPLLKFLIQTSGHVWTAKELCVVVAANKSALYRALTELKKQNLIIQIGDTYSYNAELQGTERNITIIRKNLRRNK